MVRFTPNTLREDNVSSAPGSQRGSHMRRKGTKDVDTEARLAPSRRQTRSMLLRARAQIVSPHEQDGALGSSSTDPRDLRSTLELLPDEIRKEHQIGNVTFSPFQTDSDNSHVQCRTRPNPHLDPSQRNLLWISW